MRHIELEENLCVEYHNTVKGERDSQPTKIDLEGFEALRLYHYNKLSQGECAKKLNVSQPTFSRILKKAQTTLVKAIVEGSDFKVQGGHVVYKDWIGRGCLDCDFEWKTTELDEICPKCKGKNTYLLKKHITK